MSAAVSVSPNTHSKSVNSPDKVIQLAIGFFASKTLLSANELGVFTELAKGPLDLESLRERFGLHERGAQDFFDALVALGMLERENGLYSNTAETGEFLDRAKPTYIGGLLDMFNSRLYGFWGSLTEALKTGKPQNEAKSGSNIFDAVYSDPALMRRFLSAMTGLSVVAGRTLAAKFPWKQYGTFVDVGCAQGAVPVQLSLAHPHLVGAGYDIPPVKPVFEEYVESFGLAKRVAFRSGDFFKEPLPTADVLIMGHILHDWNLEEKRLLLAKAYEALPKGGALIVHEMLIDDQRRQPSGLLASLNMLIETPGGFDFTGAECRGWMLAAGFRETRVEPLSNWDGMVVGIK